MSTTPVFPTPVERAVVVGGGIAGLTAAFRLRQRGFAVTVLEAAPEVGGKMSSLRRDGFTVNRAANILPSSYAALRALAGEVGPGGALGEIAPVLGVPRDGTLHRMRASGLSMLLDGAGTGLLSWRSKLRLRNLMVDALRIRGSLSYADLGRAAPFDTETVAGYCERRLDPDIRTYLVEPIVRALYTSNAEDVSVVDFFFAALNFVGCGLLRYPGGIDFLCRELASHLDVRTGTRAVRVEEDDREVTVELADGSVERAAACVVAVSGAHVPDLVPGLDPVVREILAEQLRYCVTVAAHVALDFRPDETAQILPIPRTEHPDLCVVTHDHNSSPDAVPAGKGLVSSYWLHEWGTARAGRGDDELLAEMVPVLDRFVPGLADGMLFAQVDRWDPAVVRSRPGWYAQVARLGARLGDARRVQLAGDYLSASSTNACAVSGELAAQRVERAVLRTDTVPVAAS